MSAQGTKIPPPWNGWLCYEYDDIPNVIKKNTNFLFWVYKFMLETANDLNLFINQTIINSLLKYLKFIFCLCK